MTRPMTRPFGYGERIPPASSIPAVTTSSPRPTVTAESMFSMSRLPGSWPRTSPVDALARSWPMTVDAESLISWTVAELERGLDHPPDERAAGGNRDVADLDAVVTCRDRGRSAAGPRTTRAR